MRAISSDALNGFRDKLVQCDNADYNKFYNLHFISAEKVKFRSTILVSVHLLIRAYNLREAELKQIGLSLYGCFCNSCKCSKIGSN